MPKAALHKESEELYGVSCDNGVSFIDHNMNPCGLNLFMSHPLFDTSKEAADFKKKVDQCYDNAQVVKVVIGTTVTAA